MLRLNGWLMGGFLLTQMVLGRPVTAEPLLEVEGVLSADDPVLADGSHYDEYTIEGQAGEEITATLESTDFDTFLFVGNANREVLATNDNAIEGSTDSAITLTLPEDGTYFVVANSFDSSGSGSYRLTVQSGAEVPSLEPEMTLLPGTYNAGSRYIVIASQGNRLCYQGISVPSGRYAVAVGETTGSLSFDTDTERFRAVGWEAQEATVSLSQLGDSLGVMHGEDVAGKYAFFSETPLGTAPSEALERCLGSTGVFFEPAPGYSLE